MDLNEASGSDGTFVVTVTDVLCGVEDPSFEFPSTVNFLKSLPDEVPLTWLPVPEGCPVLGAPTWMPPRSAISCAVGGPAILLRRKTKDHLSKFAVERRAPSSTSLPLVPR